MMARGSDPDWHKPSAGRDFGNSSNLSNDPEPWNDPGPWLARPNECLWPDGFPVLDASHKSQASPKSVEKTIETWAIDSPTCDPLQRNSQVGLIDLFYATTLFALVLGLNNFISSSAAVILCGALLVYFVLRHLPAQYGMLGGLQAFGTGILCLPLMLGLAGLSPLGEVVLCLAFPSSAYVLGAIYTELRAMDW